MKNYQMLLAPILGWLTAQLIKYIVSLRKDGFTFSDFISSGGFPSSHAAFVIAPTTLVGFNYGINSVLFAICAVFSAIILYDSTGVRRTTGDQTEVIKELKNLLKFKTKHEIHISKGHNFVEVTAGGLVGLLVGYLLYVAL
jgi:acid phosphatase family membrane protein YuiD